ncbi:MAG: hypothetical protein U1E77_18800 [Inhella sp.]
MTDGPLLGRGRQCPGTHVTRVLRNANLTVVNNLFSAEGGSFGRGGGARWCPAR